MYDSTRALEDVRWFRKTGPVAIDFINRAVCRRIKKLAELKSLVGTESISMLVGPPASGKTILALNLAYELCKESKTYYFDCDKVRNIDGSRLLSDLRAVKGRVIIDNIHLAPQEFQSVYSRFRHDRDRHLLFVSRSTFEDFQYSRLDDIMEVPQITPEPIKASGELINAYCTWHEMDLIAPEALDEIKEVVSDNLWLLAYLLEGYRKAGGKGQASQWVKDGVLRDLQDLENTDALFPEVLVAVAALFRHELLMAETYLTNKLNFTPTVLNGLSQRGELVRHDGSDGEVFYGLPHKELAYAYWDFGSKYKRRRNLTDYESIIYQYVSLGPSNGLRALATIEDEMSREPVMVKLEKEGELPKIISGEQSTGAVGSWLAAADTSTIAREDILKALAGRIVEHDHAIYVPDLLKKLFFRGEEIWNAFRMHMDCEKLACNTVSTGGAVWVGITIFEMFKYDNVMMSELYACIDFNDLLRELNETDDTWTIARCISAIYRVDPDAHKKLKAGFEWQSLADRLCSSNLLWSTEQCLRDIMYANPNAARRLCGLMSVKELVKAFDNRSGSMTTRGQVIATIWRANHAFGEKLWQVYKETFIQEIRTIDDPVETIGDIRAIGLDNPKMACEIVDSLDHEMLAKALSSVENLMEKVEFARWFINRKKTAGKNFWQQYKYSLATSLADPLAISSIAPCLREIALCGKEKPYELCSLLNVGKMADNLNTSVDFWSTVDDILATVLRTNNPKGQALWKSIKCGQAPHPEGRIFSDIWRGLSSVQDISSIDQDAAIQLCAQLDISLLADRLSQASSLFVKEVGEWIIMMRDLIPARGKQLWEDLDKKQLATTLSSTDNVTSLASCFEQVYRAQEQDGWIEELCEYANPDQLAFTLKQTQDDEDREKLITVISEGCPVFHKKLMCLLNEP
ncbi:ATP-binding protein [Planctomycetota bacterium]